MACSKCPFASANKDAVDVCSCVSGYIEIYNKPCAVMKKLYKIKKTKVAAI